MPIRQKNTKRDLAANGKEIERDFRKILVAADQAIVSGTPVKTGRLRANWFMDFGSVEEKTTQSLNAPNTSRGNAWNLTDGNVFIHNSLTYAAVIDAGRGFRDGQLRGSEQAPQGILDPAIAAIRARFG